jgi:hypothetical protein
MGTNFENVNAATMGMKLRWKIKMNNLDETLGWNVDEKNIKIGFRLKAHGSHDCIVGVVAVAMQTTTKLRI